MRAVAVLVVLLSASTASAHPLDMASLRLLPGVDGGVDVRFDLSLGTPGFVGLEPTGVCSVQRSFVETSGAVQRVRAHWDCGPGGLLAAEGRLVGAEDRGLETLIVIGDRTAVLRGGREIWTARELEERPQPLGAHVRSGATHILQGVDHLLFVALLLVLVSGGRALVVTITAFTLGHSITLATATLGGPAPAVAPTEALIAASVLIVAVEAARPLGERGAIGRRPAIAAAVFGLLHGFGFAGTLMASGLPAGAEINALLGFNLGVELGQLVFVAACLFAARLLNRDPAKPLAYLAGTWAAFLLLTRVAALG
jgi:hypothetical protein